MSGNEILNVVLIIALFGLLIYLSLKVIKQFKKLTISSKKINGMRIMFGLSALLCFVSIFLSTSLMEYARSILLTICILLFAIMTDGICDEGFFILGSIITYKNVKAYDYSTDNKKMSLYFEYSDEKNSILNQTIEFDLKQEEIVLKTLKDNIGKKYRRMKK